jgi:hypothetical protein
MAQQVANDLMVEVPACSPEVRQRAPTQQWALKQLEAQMMTSSVELPCPPEDVIEEKVAMGVLLLTPQWWVAQLPQAGVFQ